MIKTFKCICCYKKIYRLYSNKFQSEIKPNEDNWRGGDVNRFYLGYGSRCDDNTYLIAICDDCIQDRFDKGIIIKL